MNNPNDLKKSKISLVGGLLAALFLLVCVMPVHGQETDSPLPGKEKKTIIDAVTDNYTNWGKVVLNGKLSSSILPVSATVKVYMEKDNLTLISISAPLVGEAVRIELDKDNLLMVNKMTRKYAVVSVEKLEQVYPDAQKDLQNLLLGRVAIMGKGALSKKDYNEVEIYDIADDELMIVPNEKYQPQGAAYAYVLDKGSKKLKQFLLVTEEEGNEMACNYTWQPDGGLVFDFVGIGMGHTLDGAIKFNAPQWGGKPFERFEITSKYSQTSPFNLLRF